MSVSINSIISGTGGGSSSILSRSGAEASVTGTTAETILATITIPGGTMGDDGALRIELMVSYSNNANLKRVKVKFGGVLFGQPADFSTTGMWMGVVRIQNRSAAVQRGPGATAGIATTGQGTTGAISGFTVNTSVDQDIVITGQVDNAADTFKLEGYSIELIK